MVNNYCENCNSNVKESQLERWTSTEIITGIKDVYTLFSLFSRFYLLSVWFANSESNVSVINFVATDKKWQKLRFKFQQYVKMLPLWMSCYFFGNDGCLRFTASYCTYKAITLSLREKKNDIGWARVCSMCLLIGSLSIDSNRKDNKKPFHFNLHIARLNSSIWSMKCNEIKWTWTKIIHLKNVLFSFLVEYIHHWAIYRILGWKTINTISKREK